MPTIDLISQARYINNPEYIKVHPEKVIELFNSLADALDTLTARAEQAERELAELKEANRWISVKDGLPKEHDSMFAKFYGTDNWNNVMWQKQSNQVNVAIEFEVGTRIASTLYTHDGEWKYTNKIIKQKVTHWRPLPQPPQKGE